MKVRIVCKQITEDYWIGWFESEQVHFFNGLVADGDSERRVTEVLIALMAVKVRIELSDQLESFNRIKQNTDNHQVNHVPPVPMAAGGIREFELAF
ncbi:MAG: hypothetical protein H6606_05970 [Flavobacteriales bacterium]|nr:hypothetical protein [Flavobacteriales bacterium]